MAGRNVIVRLGSCCDDRSVDNGAFGAKVAVPYNLVVRISDFESGYAGSIPAKGICLLPAPSVVVTEEWPIFV